MADVFCSHTEMVDLEKIIPNPRNPNTHPESQIKILAKVISGNGWRQPITVSKRSGFVVKGHGRLSAAKLLGETKVPVDFQEYESEALEWADMIADNRIAELAEIDRATLADIIGDLDDGEFDLELTGFEEVDLEELMTAAVPNFDQGQLDQLEPKMVECPNCRKSFDSRGNEK